MTIKRPYVHWWISAGSYMIQMKLDTLNYQAMQPTNNQTKQNKQNKPIIKYTLAITQVRKKWAVSITTVRVM